MQLPLSLLRSLHVRLIFHSSFNWKLKVCDFSSIGKILLCRKLLLLSEACWYRCESNFNENLCTHKSQVISMIVCCANKLLSRVWKYFPSADFCCSFTESCSMPNKGSHCHKNLQSMMRKKKKVLITIFSLAMSGRK